MWSAEGCRNPKHMVPHAGGRSSLNQNMEFGSSIIRSYSYLLGQSYDAGSVFLAHIRAPIPAEVGLSRLAYLNIAAN